MRTAYNSVLVVRNLGSIIAKKRIKEDMKNPTKNTNPFFSMK
jgi:hypothetical protein